MGCGATKVNEGAVKAEFAVTPSSCGDVWPGLDRSGFAEVGAIVLIAKEQTKSKPRELTKLTDIVDKSFGNVLFKVKGGNNNGEVLEFFDTAERLVALRGERQNVIKGNAWWLMWSAKPAAENQKSGRTHAGVPLYQWGMFRWGRVAAGSLVQYDEVQSEEDRRFARKEPHTEGNSLLAFQHRDSPAGSDTILYGPGKEKTSKKKETWLHGKPMAIFKNGPIRITMAPAADPILLFVAAECNNFLDECDELANYAGG